jgi:hypothetical protein
MLKLLSTLQYGAFRYSSRSLVHAAVLSLLIMLLGHAFATGAEPAAGDSHDAGTVLGNATLDDLNTLTRIAFIHDGHDFHYFAMPGQLSTVIVGLSPDGKTAVGWSTYSNDPFADPGATFMLDVQTWTFTAINPTQYSSTPYSWAVARGASPSLRYVTGIAGNTGDPNTVGFIWDRLTNKTRIVTTIPGCDNGVGVSRANDQGDALEYCFVPPDYHIKALLAPGNAEGTENTALVPLVPSGATAASNISPLGINSWEMIVGLWSTSLSAPNQGFFARPNGLGQFEIMSYKVPNAYSTNLSGINDQGVIAGNYADGDATHITRGPIFKLSNIDGRPVVFNPGEGYSAQSWGINALGWIHGYVQTVATALQQ